MSWATAHIEKLKAGETVKFRPHGNSMAGKIESGQLVTVAPVEPYRVEVGDIVLCKVNGKQFLHLVKAIRQAGSAGVTMFQIGNNKGRINGWTSYTQVYGRCIKVEP